MNNNEIVIIYQETGKKPQFQKIKNDICEFEKILEGEIDVISYEDVVIVCKKDRKKLRPNIYINNKFLSLGETIRGNIIIVCMENEEFKSLTKEQVIKYFNFLKNASFHYDNIDENGRIISSNSKKRFTNFEKEISLSGCEKNRIDNNQSKDDNILKMILGIQTMILKFIKNNEN